MSIYLPLISLSLSLWMFPINYLSIHSCPSCPSVLAFHGLSACETFSFFQPMMTFLLQQGSSFQPGSISLSLSLLLSRTGFGNIQAGLPRVSFQVYFGWPTIFPLILKWQWEVFCSVEKEGEQCDSVVISSLTWPMLPRSERLFPSPPYRLPSPCFLLTQGMRLSSFLGRCLILLTLGPEPGLWMISRGVRWWWE